jgi:hypothetical protein
MDVRLRDRRIFLLPQRGQFFEKRITVTRIRESAQDSQRNADELKHT